MVQPTNVVDLVDSQNVLAVVAGLSAHAIMARFELWPRSLALLGTIGLASGITFLHRSRDMAIRSAIGMSVHFTLILLATLFTSMVIYRIFFHRLSSVPGPLGLKISKWRTVPTDLNGNRAHYIQGLHKKYGDVVRTGPREISVNDPSVIAAIGGANSPFIKGPWYVGVHGGKGSRAMSLHSTIRKQDHSARRRIWDSGFSAKALRSYEGEVKQTTEALLEQLSTLAKEEKVVNLEEWCMFYGFDVMGKVGFSRSFDLLGTGTLSRGVKLLIDAMSLIMVVANVPYMSEVARLLPNPIKDLEDWLEEALEERKSRGRSIPDVFGYLLDEDEQTGWVHTKEELIADAMLMVIAGSDTSSIAMSLCLYHVIVYPKSLKLLQEELESVFHGEQCTDFDKLAKECPYLNAIINETLRLYPPVASGLQRELPGNVQPVTLNVHGKSVIVPQNVIVTTPTLAMQRDSRSFSPDPNEFRPERWLKPDNEIAFNRAAFNPFSYGPTSCVGKTLAFMEIRIVVASIVTQFDMTLEPGFDAPSFPKGLMDIFTTKCTKELPVRLHTRKAKSNH